MSRRFGEVFPAFKIGDPDWALNTSLIEYVGNTGSFRNTTLPDGKITGMELHLGILDDFVKGRADANSKSARDKAWEWFADDFLTRFANDSAMLAICTRWHLDDLLGRLKRKWPEMVMLEFPAIAEKDEKWRKKGDPLFPEHKDLAFLLERKALMSPGSWQADSCVPWAWRASRWHSDGWREGIGIGSDRRCGLRCWLLAPDDRRLALTRTKRMGQVAGT